MKRIVLCSDGTGNKGGVGRDTNVWRLYNAVDRSVAADNAIPQIAFYDDGIGTQKWKILKASGGAFGFGLSRNIRQLYEALARNYEPGDEIYVFGFSRGAYTARVLAALVCQCGVLRIEDDWSQRAVKSRIREALRHHRDSYDKPILTGWLRALYSGLRNKQKTAEEYRKALSHDRSWDPKGEKKIVTFVGVWDTVSAIGSPVFGITSLINTFLYRVDFPDHAVHTRVAKARHALAMDDERATFHPELWDEKTTQTIARDCKVDCPDVEQIWFPGVHSNVGGGYPKQGLAYASLAWIMNESGLRFSPHELSEANANINPADKLYNSRAGLAAYYRYKPRAIASLAKCYTGGIAKIDLTAFERINLASDDYAPGNLPIGAKAIDSAERGSIDLDRVNKAMELGKAELDDSTSIMAANRVLVLARQILQTLLVVTTATLGITAYFPSKVSALVSRLGIDTINIEVKPEINFLMAKLFGFVASMLPESLATGFTNLQTWFENYPWTFWALLFWLFVLLTTKWYLRSACERRYAKFWHNVRAHWRKHSPDTQTAAETNTSSE